MKIALINNFPPYSGTGRYPYQLWDEYKKSSGVEADLFCTHVMEKHEFDWFVNQGVKFLHKKAYKDSEWASRLAIYFLDGWRIPKKYDLYHLTSHMLGHFVPRLKPCVVTIHDLLQFKYADKIANPLTSWLYNSLLRRSLRLTKGADKIICVSEWTRQQVIKQFALNSTKVVTVHNGVDHNLFKPGDKIKARRETSLPEEKKIVLHVGSETKRKNIAGLLRAIAILYSWGEDVLLVRVGEETASTHALIGELGLEGRVVYYYKVPEERLPLYYQAADVVVLPSFDEGFGFPLVEAMACGIPVVTSDRGPMLEVVADAAFTADPHDPKEFASYIRNLFRDQDLHQQLSEKAYERSQQFSWEKCARQVEEVYREVLRI